MTSPPTTVHDPAAASDNRLVVAISSRALFDLGDSHALFEREGLDAYRAFQIDHEDEILQPGVAFPLVQKLLGLNKLAGDVPPVEVILLSRNSGDTGLRIFNAIQHYGLEISRAAFTSGAPTSDYIAPFKADLFLSANAEDVGRALAAGVAAATILP
ncbi:MAG TPA: 5'-nucleotidase, partial [Rhodanobacter sp.]